MITYHPLADSQSARDHLSRREFEIARGSTLSRGSARSISDQQAVLPKSVSCDDGRDGIRCANGVVNDNDDDRCDISRKLDGGSFELAEGLVTRGLLFVLLLPLPLPALMLPRRALPRPQAQRCFESLHAQRGGAERRM